MLEFMMIDIPLPPQEPVKVRDLEVSLIFKETGIQETVHFQSLDVFKWIEPEVNIKSWKIRERIEDEIEIITDGSTYDSLITYVKNEKFEF